MQQRLNQEQIRETIESFEFKAAVEIDISPGRNVDIWEKMSSLETEIIRHVTPVTVQMQAPEPPKTTTLFSPPTRRFQKTLVALFFKTKTALDKFVAFLIKNGESLS